MKLNCRTSDVPSQNTLCTFYRLLRDGQCNQWSGGWLGTHIIALQRSRTGRMPVLQCLHRVLRSILLQPAGDPSETTGLQALDADKALWFPSLGSGKTRGKMWPCYNTVSFLRIHFWSLCGNPPMSHRNGQWCIKYFHAMTSSWDTCINPWMWFPPAVGLADRRHGAGPWRLPVRVCLHYGLRLPMWCGHWWHSDHPLSHANGCHTHYRNRKIYVSLK